MQEVRRLRLEKDWTQTELAYHADLAPSVISEIETGRRSPSAATLRKLAVALGVSVPDLFERVDPLKGQAPLPFDRSQEEASVERRVLADTLDDLNARLNSQANNLPEQPQDDTERVRVEEALKQLIDVFFGLVDSLANHRVTDEELRSRIIAIGTKTLPKISNWLHEYGETAQLEKIDEKVKIWTQTTQQGNEISRR